MVGIASHRCIVMALVAGLTGAGVGVAHADDRASETTQITRVDGAERRGAQPAGLPHFTIAELRLSARGQQRPRGCRRGVGSVMLVDRPTGLPLPGRPVEGAALSAGSAHYADARPALPHDRKHSSGYADAAHVRELGLDGKDRVVSKVGVEFKAAQSDWKIAYGGLGFRLAGDARA